MADIPPLDIQTRPSRLPVEDALEPLKTQASIYIGPNATVVQRTWAGFSGDKNCLDLGDVFHALAHPPLYGKISEIRGKLLETLGYREEDPLQFKTLPLGPDQQLALTLIDPKDRDPNEPTLIFGTGFAHPASLYMASMIALANTLKTQVVVIDQPGNGGSQSSRTVNQNDLYRALKLAITTSVAEGGRYYVGGHSLGSAPAYRLFRDIRDGKSPVGNRELVRMVVVNPIPTRLQESSGGAGISRAFMLGGVASQVAHGFQGMKANSLHLFSNETNPIVAREDMPVSTPGMVTTFGALDMDDIAAHVGSDHRVVVMLSKNDRLMNWNVGAYTSRRGYHLIDGDHGACLIGPHISAACTKHLTSAFRGGLDDRLPRATPGGIYRHANGVGRLGLGWRSDGAAVAIPEITLRHGLLTAGHAAACHAIGVYLGGGIATELGYRFSGSARGIAASQGTLYLGAEGLGWPVDLKVGVRGGVDFMNGDRPIIRGLVTSLGVNLARIIDVEAQGRFTLSGQFQDIIAGVALRFL